jgi:carbamoyl-phosphate synthase large subunit
MKILITGVGGPTPRSFVNALRKYSRYAKYEFVGTDCNNLAIGLYQHHLFNKTFLIPRVDNESMYWEAIEKIVSDEKVDYAVILPELELLAWAKRAEKGKLPCKALIPDFNLAKSLVDKATMTDILEPYDLVPKSFTILREDILSDHTKFKLTFPFWIRSASGSSGLGSLKVNSLQELKNWMQINPAVEKFLASEFLPGRNLGCKMLYHNGELLRSALAERVQYIMTKVAPSGITGNSSFGRLLNDPKVTAVASKALDIMFDVTKSPKHGFFTVDLKENENGVPMVTEVNVRFVAFTQCYAAGGANLAEDLIRVLDNDPSFDRNFKLYEFEPGLIFLRDVDEIPIIMHESQLL